MLVEVGVLLCHKPDLDLSFEKLFDIDACPQGQKFPGASRRICKTFGIGR